MLSSLVVSLPGRIFQLLLLQVFLGVSDSFLVVGPSEPIVAMLGAEAVLPCFVDPAMSVENMELRWYRSQFSEAVYVYEDGMEQEGEQLEDFRGRTELVKDRMSEGRVAVRIYRLQVSDNGLYRCFFRKGNNFEEATLELRVIGLGSRPHIHMVGLEDTGIKLMCTGKGWFPHPEIQWKGAKGEKMLSLSEDETQGDDGLLQVEASLIVTDSSNNKVSCSMKNPFFGEEQMETISISEPFFPRASYWKEAFAVAFCVFMTFLVAFMLCAWKRKKKKRRLQKGKEREVEERKIKEPLLKELGQRKTLYQQADVSLDPITTHPNLILSKNRRCVSIVESADLGSDDLAYHRDDEFPPIHIVLGQNRFTTGKHYWEVKLTVGKEDGTNGRCGLGIHSATVKSVGKSSQIPEYQWLLTIRRGAVFTPGQPPKYLQLTWHPHRIGVFLDYDAGDVSFYNMENSSHIYSFTGFTFHGVLRPCFSLQGPGTTVRVCLASDNVNKICDLFKGM